VQVKQGHDRRQKQAQAVKIVPAEIGTALQVKRLPGLSARWPSLLIFRNFGVGGPDLILIEAAQFAAFRCHHLKMG
jgi:hypothetical protein